MDTSSNSPHPRSDEHLEPHFYSAFNNNSGTESRRSSASFPMPPHPPHQRGANKAPNSVSLAQSPHRQSSSTNNTNNTSEERLSEFFPRIATRGGSVTRDDVEGVYNSHPTQIEVGAQSLDGHLAPSQHLNTSGNTPNRSAQQLSGAAMPPIGHTAKGLPRCGSGSRGSSTRLGSVAGLTNSASFHSGRTPSDVANGGGGGGSHTSGSSPSHKSGFFFKGVGGHTGVSPVGTPRRARVSLVVPCSVEEPTDPSSGPQSMRTPSTPPTNTDDSSNHNRNEDSSLSIDGNPSSGGVAHRGRVTTPLTTFHPSIPVDSSITNCSVSQYAYTGTPLVNDRLHSTQFSDSFGDGSSSHNVSSTDPRPKRLVPCAKAASLSDASLSTPHSTTNSSYQQRLKRFSTVSVESAGGPTPIPNLPTSPAAAAAQFDVSVSTRPDVDPSQDDRSDPANQSDVAISREDQSITAAEANNSSETEHDAVAATKEAPLPLVPSPKVRPAPPTEVLSSETKCIIRARLFASFLEEGVLLYRPHSKLTSFYDFSFLQRESTAGAFRRHYCSAFVQGPEDAVAAVKEAHRASRAVLDAIMNPMDTKATLALFDTNSESGLGCFWLGAESERQWFTVSAPPEYPLAQCLQPRLSSSTHTPHTGAFFFPSFVDADESLTTRIVHPNNLCMFAVDVPPVSLSDYMARLISRMRCTLECFVYAMCLVRRVSSSAAFQHASWAAVQEARQQRRIADHIAKVKGLIPPAHSSSVAQDMDKPMGWIPLTTRSVHRLFLTALVVSAKMRNDRYFGMTTYAEVTGVSKADLIGMEVALLTNLQYTAAVSTSEYTDMLFSLRHHCSLLAHSKHQDWAAQAWVSLIEHFTLPPVGAFEAELAAYEDQLQRTLSAHQHHTNTATHQSRAVPTTS